MKLFILQSRRKSFVTRVLILLILMFISSLNSINSNNLVKNSSTKSKNQLLSRLNKSRNQRSKVRVKTELTKENIKEIVQTINDLRNQVAMGKTPKGNSLPRAADMLQIYWSPTIAKGAQEWANRCERGHSAIGKYKFKGGNVRETMFMSEYQESFGDSAFVSAPKGWFDEIRNYNENVEKVEYKKGGPVVGHFLSVIWAKSYLVGCGYCQTKKEGMTRDYITCHFYIEGYNQGLPVYKTRKGNECECPQGTACKNTDYPGLCCPTVTNWCKKDSIFWTE